MLLAFAIAFAATSTADAAPSPPAEVKEERKICMREESTGSRLGSKRICKTAAEWKAMQGDGVDASRYMNAMKQQ